MLELDVRDRMILGLLSHGLTQQMVADEIGYSRETVDDRLETIRIKLRAKTTQHAIAIALRAGLIR